MLKKIILCFRILMAIVYIFNGVSCIRFSHQKSRRSHIVRARATSIERHPYQIGYYQIMDKFGAVKDYRMTKFCSGSIINERWVVTAGHCVNRAPESNAFTEFLCSGSSYINCKGGTLHKIERRILHPDYQELDNKTVNDIGLLKVKNPFVYNERVRRIELATSWPGLFTLGTVSGWGANENGTLSPHLLETVHIIEPNFFCRIFLGIKLFGLFGKSSIMCSLSTSYICAGDSGGPLVVDNALVGIVSMGLSNEFCKTYSFAQSFFTTVPNYLSWIASAIYEEGGENVTALPPLSFAPGN